MKTKLIDATDIKTVGDLAQAIADGREIVGEKKLFDEDSGEETIAECPITAAHSIGVLPQVLAEYSMKECVDAPWYEQLDETGPVWCRIKQGFDGFWVALVRGLDPSGRMAEGANGRSIEWLEKCEPLTQGQLDAFGLKNGYLVEDGK